MSDEHKTVVGLTRVSTRDQAADDRAGLDRQMEVINRTIRQKGLNCIKTYEVSDVSGTNVRNCPEIREILRLVEGGVVSGVVLPDLDRLLRPDRFEDFSLLQVFQDSGAILYCGPTELDLSSKDGFLTGGIRASVAGFELRLIKERMLGAKEEKRKQGKCPSSAITLPHGVAYDRKAEKYNYTTEVSQVVEAFRLVDEQGVTNYCELSRRTGIQARTLHNILRNKIYIGIRSYTTKRGREKYVRKDGRQSDRKKVFRKPEEVIAVKVIDLPAVPTDRFERVQQILAGVKTTWHIKRKENRSVNLGTGVAHCGYCEERLYCSSGKRKGTTRQGYYYCKRNYYFFKEQLGGCQMHNVRQDLLDETIRTFTAERLVDEKVIKEIILHHMAAQGANSASAGSAEERREESIKDLQRRLRRLTDGYEAGAIELEEFRVRSSMVKKKISVLTALPNGTVDTPDESAWENIARLIVRGAMAFSRLKQNDLQQQAIRQLFSRITFKDEAIVGFQLNPAFVASYRETGNRMGTGSSLPPA